ncbi:MAG: hypothetical protein IKG88_00595 [Bacteroidales bacterium]|nr:hypothetical protein [Bacteroidales bacterium]
MMNTFSGWMYLIHPQQHAVHIVTGIAEGDNLSVREVLLEVAHGYLRVAEEADVTVDVKFFDGVVPPHYAPVVGSLCRVGLDLGMDMFLYPVAAFLFFVQQGDKQEVQ